MDKILVTIYVLELDQEFDLLVPINILCSEALELIQQSIVDLSSGVYEKNQQPLLFSESGQLINLKNIVKFSGLKNGCKVLLK